MDWETFYKENDESAIDFMIRLTSLRERKLFKNIELALKAYLRYRGDKANATMYELLAVAIKQNGGSPNEIQAALGSAAYLARRGTDPKQMTSVADLMVIQGYDELTIVDRAGRKVTTSVGDLLDLAMEKAPHSERPIIMSMNLAQRRKDPERMARAIEALMSLGWPGLDETFRAQAHKMAEDLAKRLNEEGLHVAARTLLGRLAAAEGRDLFLRLTWKGDADIDMEVGEPLGATASVLIPRTVFGGALLKNGYGSHPEEVYVCPRGFDGDYTVRFKIIYNDDKAPVTEANLEIITHEGTPGEKVETRTVRLDSASPEPVVIHLDGGRRKNVLPFVAPPLIKIVRDKDKPKDAAKDRPAARTEAPSTAK